MSDTTATGVGSDRAVARALSRIAATAPARPAQPAASPVRDAAPADVASLSNVAASLAAKPPVDAERVQQIKKAIANGTFPILPATVADRLLAVRYEWMNDEA